MTLTPPSTLDKARTLRSESTDAEKALWRLLRERRLDGWKFRRQHPVPPYVLDFACLDARLAVEADGGQHNGSGRDELRAEFLAAAGWRVMRFWNNDILANPEGVAETIRAALSVGMTLPSPSHAAGVGPSLSHRGRERG